MSYHYVWLIWSSAFLVPWLILYWALPRYRLQMGWTSLLMAIFGLTEPLFIPEYWNPPTVYRSSHPQRQRTAA